MQREKNGIECVEKRGDKKGVCTRETFFSFTRIVNVHVVHIDHSHRSSFIALRHLLFIVTSLSFFFPLTENNKTKKSLGKFFTDC